MPPAASLISASRPIFPGNPVTQALLPLMLWQAQQQNTQQDRFQRQQPDLTSAKPTAYIPPIPSATTQPGYQPLRIVYNNDPHEKFKALPKLVSAFNLFSQQGQQTGRDVLRLNSGDNNVGRELEEWQLQARMLT